MKSAIPYYRKRLEEELLRRIKKNPRYSIRSFAQSLGMQGGPLNQILSGKRFLSLKAAEKIFARIDLNVRERQEFLASLAKARAEAGLTRTSSRLREALSTSNSSGDHLPQKDLTGDAFTVLADWYHFAILEMTETRTFDADPRKIAAKLGITTTEARAALQRLLDLEMVEVQSGRLRKTNLRFSSHDKTKTSALHRKRQKQILEKSLTSLQQDPIEVRNHSSITFAIDPTKIPLARERIEKFFWEMSELLSSDPSHVYEMNVGLFPLEKAPSKMKESQS